jgi:hypothetical protein
MQFPPIARKVRRNNLLPVSFVAGGATSGVSWKDSPASRKRTVIILTIFFMRSHRIKGNAGGKSEQVGLLGLSDLLFVAFFGNPV